MGKMGKLGVVLSLALASAWVVADETQIVYLSGQGKDDPVDWEFYCTAGRRSGTWTMIGVPSNWELQGFGTYNYGHDKPKANEQGKYRRTFEVRAEWAGRRVFIVFDGVMTDAEVRVNGQSAGATHQGGFYRFKYDITGLIKEGKNLLEVTVSKVSADASVEQAERQADYWVFGGIFRPVYLEVVPEEYVDRVAVDARADGAFHMDVHLGGIDSAETVRAEIIRPEGEALGEPMAGVVESGQEAVTLRTQVSGHKTWTAETPILYTVRVTLLRDGQAVHTVTQRFGFRTFEVRAGDGLYLNGQKIRLKGVCRHSFWPDSGRCLSSEVSYDDVRLIKAMNMNAVRMSHYPPDRHFLEACDELGLYVLDELAGWQKPPYDTEVGKKLVREMVTRDVCHPCILFWDNGNEGGWNRELDDQFALYDPQQRVVLHPWEAFGGVDTDHYESYASTARKLSGSTLFLPTEFLHGLYDGGHGAGLNDYWNLTLASAMGAGGFLWVLTDEGVVRTDEDGVIDTDGNHAPDGIVGPFREKEGSFYTIKEIFSPIYIAGEALPAEFDGKLEVTNRYGFTNLNECTFKLAAMTFPGPGLKRRGHRMMGEKTLAGPDVAAGGRGVLDLGSPGLWRDADALYLTASDSAGEEIWTWSWDLRGRAHYSDRFVRTQRERGERVRVAGTADEIHLVAGELAMKFARGTGQLTGIARGDEDVAFGGGPRLIGGEGVLKEVELLKSRDSVLLDVAYEGGLAYTRWRLYATGWVSLEYEYQLDGTFEVFGVDFDFPEEQMRRMRWLGRGPFRVWKNRMKGGRLDVWSSDYKDHTPGLTWDYPEFRGYYRNWRWVVFETQAGDITMINGSGDLFLGVYRPKDGPDPRNTKLGAPRTGIALLHGIPAIGTKFQKPEALGPESQKNKATGTYRGKVWFRFGE